MKEKIQIAAILTVFNRKQKTLACLKHLFEAVEAYNKIDTRKGNVEITVFLTDDGCTDGTAEALREAFPRQDINILQGTGDLFWAGGMRFAWQAAIDSGTTWDYYLLLNDDTNVRNDVFTELFEADDYGYRTAGVHGLTSGITCQPGDESTITYGGFRFVNWTKGRFVPVLPSGEPQHIDLTHSNILLVHRSVVEKIGIFHQGFRHKDADWDYGMMALRNRIPLYSTLHVAGECENDHLTGKSEIRMFQDMTIAERKEYVNSPVHSDKDYLLFVKRAIPLRYPFAYLFRHFRLYFPQLYLCITKLRGIYK